MLRPSPSAAPFARAALTLAVLATAGCDPRAMQPHAPAGAELRRGLVANPQPGLPAAYAEHTARKAPPPAQERVPVEALQTYLDGFHFYDGRSDAQAETHQWCTRLEEEVAQCALFDGSGTGAKLTGVEYVVSERVYRQLPPDEQRLWHSHAHDVQSGTTVAPGLSAVAEHELMQRVVRTYGKAWMTWQADAGHRVPIGTPQLLMSFTAEGQLDGRLLASRDQRLGVSAAANARNRADIEAPEPRRGAPEPSDDAARLALDPRATTRSAEATAP